jgi:hypothetical protein
MKKLIVFSAIVALLAPAVFAEVSVGAWARGTVNVLQGNTIEDSDLTGSASHEARAEFSGENDEGTFGGHFKAWNNYDSGNAFGWVWWKPIDQFQLQIGHNQWAWFEFRPLVAWGFYEAACDAQVVTERWRFGNAYYGGFGDAGATISIYPIEGMAFNFGLPYEARAGQKVADIFGHLHAQFSYNISDVGTLAISFAAGKGSIGGGPTEPTMPEDINDIDAMAAYAKDLVAYEKAMEAYFEKFVKEGPGYDTSKIYAAFDVSAIENVGLSIGIGFPLAAKTWNDADDKVADKPDTYQPPIYAGVGFSYGADSFGFKARAMAGLGASYTPNEGDAVKFGTTIDFDILPYFDLGIMKLFIAAGLDMWLLSDDQKDAKAAGDDDSIVGFYINPYISKSVGAGTFFAGVRIESDGVKGKDPKNKDNSIIEFKVPIGIIFGF